MRPAADQLMLLASERTKLPHERTHADRLRDCLERVERLSEDNSVDPCESVRSLIAVKQACDRQIEALKDYE